MAGRVGNVGPARDPGFISGAASARTNRFLGAMLPEDAARVCDLLEPVPLPLGEMILPGDVPSTSVLFIDEGVLSGIARFPDGKRAEVATIGREGLIGMVGLHGQQSTPFAIVVQVPGRGRRMPLAPFAALVDRSPDLSALLTRYRHAQLIQVAQTAACNAVHAVEQRAARWLLMTHDRMGTTFELTQEYLATMLGVRRPTVNAIAQTLQQSGAIRYTRGAVVIRDRAVLERFVCPCYGVVRHAYEQAVPGCFA